MLKRRWRPWAETFGLLVAWDWLVTAGTIYMAERDLFAIPLAVGLTAFWWFAVRIANRSDRELLIPAILGSVLGTYMGIIV